MTVYALLETRFGPAARRFTSLLFMVTRVMAAAVRLAVPAIPIALILGIPIWTAVVILAGATALYTFLGGIKAVIWIDLIQVFVYLSGALLALGFLFTDSRRSLRRARRQRGGRPAGPALRLRIRPGPSLHVLGRRPRRDVSRDGEPRRRPVDRPEAARLPRPEGRAEGPDRRGLSSSSSRWRLFLSIGVMLFAFFPGRPIDPLSRALPGARRDLSDLHRAPPAGASLGLSRRRDLLRRHVLGVLRLELARLGARRTTWSARLAASAHLEGKSGLLLGRGLTLFWTVLLALLAIGFSRLSQSQPAVQVGLGLVSVTAGGLLGAFLLAIYARRARQADVLWGVTCSTVLMLALFLGIEVLDPTPARSEDRVAVVLAHRVLLAVTVGGLLSLRHRMKDTVEAVVMPGPGRPLERRRFPAPVARPGGAVLEMVATEVCGTDVHLHHGRLSGVPYPIIPGHVNCGRVLETNGPLVDVEGRAIELGTLVTFFDVFGTCGNCWHCLVAKAATRCPHRRVYGITTSAQDGLLGGWTERIEILPGVKRPAAARGDRRAQDFMGGGCGLPTGFHAVERAGIAMGDTVVVQGSGPVGLNAAIFAQLSGALRVLVVGAPRARLEAARQARRRRRLRHHGRPDPAARVRLGPRPHGGPRRRRRHRGLGKSRGRPRGPRDAARRRPLRRRRPVHRRRRRDAQPAPPHQPQARRRSSAAGATSSRTSTALADDGAAQGPRFRWRDLITREYRLADAATALADMERLAVVKALIRP